MPAFCFYPQRRIRDLAQFLSISCKRKFSLIYQRYQRLARAVRLCMAIHGKSMEAKPCRNNQPDSPHRASDVPDSPNSAAEFREAFFTCSRVSMKAYSRKWARQQSLTTARWTRFSLLCRMSKSTRASPKRRKVRKQNPPGFWVGRAGQTDNRSFAAGRRLLSYRAGVARVNRSYPTSAFPFPEKTITESHHSVLRR
jgi:hypothetical protein